MRYIKQKPRRTRIAAAAVSLSLITALTACNSSKKAALSTQALISTPQGSVQGVSTETGNRCMQPDTGDAFLTRLIEGQGLSAFKKFLIKRYVASQKPTPMSEDCLFLNVRTGNLDKTKKQPVMVWIHGGGHSFGSSDTFYYQSNGLVEKDVVLVTINYRLGAFGYMSHPALSAADPNGVSGNYGTLDQIAALKWVKDNISAYGGDPDNVTIFGESAGAWSVTELMSTPFAKGLFHKAIGQSGASSYQMIQMDEADSPYDGQGWPSGYSKGIAAAKAAGLDNPSAAELRAVPAAEFLAKTPKDAYDAFHHQRDGYVFPKNVGLAFRDGDINAVPYLTGYNADEGTLFFPNDPQPTVWLQDTKPGTTEELTAKLSEVFPTQAAKIVDLYALDSEFTTGGTQMLGDEIFGTNVSFIAEQVKAAGQPSYMYHFSRIPPSRKQTLGAFHAAELSFVFDSNIKALGVTDDDETLTQQMTTYWTNFAKTSNPNGGDSPNWPEFDGQNWMHFSANTGRPIAKLETNLRADKLTALTEGLQVKLNGLAQTKSAQSSSSNSASD